MPIISWDPKLATGDSVVDHQHKTLFQMVNELHDAITAGKAKEHLQKVLERLASYTLEHFAAEERLMGRSGYPGVAEHVRKHHDLAKKATDLIEGYRSGKLVLSLTLSQFLADWVRHHIAEEDQKMIAWIQTRPK